MRDTERESNTLPTAVNLIKLFSHKSCWDMMIIYWNHMSFGDDMQVALTIIFIIFWLARSLASCLDLCDAISEMLFYNYITSLCDAIRTHNCVWFFHSLILPCARLLKIPMNIYKKICCRRGCWLLGRWCEGVKTFKRAHTQHWWNRWWSCKFNEKRSQRTTQCVTVTRIQ